MQSTGHTGGRHLPQPEHSSGTMITSIPWLKMAPNCGGQWRRHVSQLMHSAISIRNGGSFHFGFRSRSAMRSGLVAAGMRSGYRGHHLIRLGRNVRVRLCRYSVRRADRTQQGAAVAKYTFLSDEWIAAAKAIYDEYKGKTQP